MAELWNDKYIVYFMITFKMLNITERNNLLCEAKYVYNFIDLKFSTVSLIDLKSKEVNARYYVTTEW
jgi:hypothetical protein